MIEKKDLINLLTNRLVFNKQYNFNTIRLIKDLLNDKVQRYLLIALAIILGYESMKNSQYPLVSLFALEGGILCLFLFNYYAFRAHRYETFMQKKEQLSLSYWKQVIKGKILSVYILSEYSEKTEEIKSFLENDASISELTLWYLNTRIRSWNRPIGTRKFKEKIESEISDAVYKEFEIHINFYVSSMTENIIELDGLDISQVYSNYDEWRKLEVKNTDVPWLICRFIVISCIIGIVLFSVALIAGHF